jgi:hypothetical protein
MAPERSGDRLEHLSIYRQRCSTCAEELSKESAAAEAELVLRARADRAFESRERVRDAAPVLVA